MWLDGCVGSHNHVRFLSFLTLHVLSCGLYAAFALFVLKGAVSAELAANALGSGACQVRHHKQTHTKNRHASIQLRPGGTHWTVRYLLSDAIGTWALLCGPQVIRVLLLRPIFPLLVLCGFAAMCVAGLGFLLVDQLINLCRNLTTNEKINMARYPWLVTPEGRFHNRFDRYDRQAWQTASSHRSLLRLCSLAQIPVQASPYLFPRPLAPPPPCVRAARLTPRHVPVLVTWQGLRGQRAGVLRTQGLPPRLRQGVRGAAAVRVHPQVAHAALWGAGLLPTP